MSPASLITTRSSACARRTAYWSGDGGETTGRGLPTAHRPMNRDTPRIAARTRGRRPGFTKSSRPSTSLIGNSEIRNPLENKGSSFPNFRITVERRGKRHLQISTLCPHIAYYKAYSKVVRKGGNGVPATCCWGIYRIYRKYRSCFSCFSTTDLASRRRRRVLPDEARRARLEVGSCRRDDLRNVFGEVARQRTKRRHSVGWSRRGHRQGRAQTRGQADRNRKGPCRSGSLLRKREQAPRPPQPSDSCEQGPWGTRVKPPLARTPAAWSADALICYDGPIFPCERPHAHGTSGAGMTHKES